jgi:hypothetical protein
MGFEDPAPVCSSAIYRALGPSNRAANRSNTNRPGARQISDESVAACAALRMAFKPGKRQVWGARSQNARFGPGGEAWSHPNPVVEKGLQT